MVVLRRKRTVAYVIAHFFDLTYRGCINTLLHLLTFTAFHRNSSLITQISITSWQNTRKSRNRKAARRSNEESQSGTESVTLREDIKRYWRGCLLVLCLLILLSLCGALGYLGLRPAARQELNRLAELRSWDASSLDTVRLALLQRLPIGTSEHDIYTYLVRHSAIQRDNPGTYDDHPILYRKKTNNVITAIINADPKAFHFQIIPFCRDSYAVNFVLDNNGRLTNISVREWGGCA
jgi:hypothetical protein